MRKKENKLLEMHILQIVEKAIDLAIEDTGLQEKNYSMLEERIQSYLNIDSFERGYEIVIFLDRELFTVKIERLDIVEYSK